MKYYVGQIILVDETSFGSSGKFPTLGMITDRVLYHYNSFDRKIVIHPLDVKDSHLEIDLDEDGEPTSGNWFEADKAMNTFLQLIKDLKKDEAKEEENIRRWKYFSFVEAFPDF
jgi:hypothetical protein